MSNTMKKYTALDLQILTKKKGKIVTSEEALKDVQPVEWGEDVLRGRKKVKVVRVKDGEAN